MEDVDRDVAPLLRVIQTAHMQLLTTPLDDPQRDRLYHDILGYYRDAFSLLKQRIAHYQSEHLTAQDG